MKKRLFEISKIIIFLLVFAVGLQSLSFIFIPKNNTKNSGIKYENARGFYGEAKNTIDVYALGNSDLYSAMNPLQLWHEHGITSYVSGEPSQNVFAAYYLLKDFLSCHKPKVVMLEVDELFSLQEADALDESINNFIKNVFPIFEYHSRWKTLTAEDFSRKYEYTDRNISKGYIFHDNTISYQDGNYMTKNKHKNITKTTKLYLKKLIDLARENGSEVMFVWYPSATSATYKRHKVVKELANQYDVPFIDFNMDDYDTGFNWLTDSRDGGNHLNYFGATKMTKFIGNYLKKNYELTDHRNDEVYKQWDLDYELFLKRYINK